MASVSDQSDSGWWLVAGWGGYGSDLRSDDRRGFMGDPTRWSYRDTGDDGRSLLAGTGWCLTERAGDSSGGGVWRSFDL